MSSNIPSNNRNHFNSISDTSLLCQQFVALISIVIISIILGTSFSMFDSNNNHCVYAAKYNLPAGVQNQTGLKEIKETFECKAEGYFADTDNDCKIYHHCNSFNKKGKGGKLTQSSMACGEGQVFDQSKLSCLPEDDAIPCEASSDFFYLNDRIGDPTAAFLTDADIERAQKARPNYRR